MGSFLCVKNAASVAAVVAVVRVCVVFYERQGSTSNYAIFLLLRMVMSDQR